MNSIYKKIVLFTILFLSIICIKNYSIGFTGFKYFDNSPRMTITCNKETYDDVIIKFRDYSGLDESKIFFYTVENGQIGNKITDSNFIKKIDRIYATYNASVLAECHYIISKEYLNKKTNNFYVTVSDRFNSPFKLEAFFRIKNVNGRYTANTPPRVNDWESDGENCSFVIQDWVGVNYVRLYDMNSKDTSKVVFAKNNLAKGNTKVSFSLNNFTEKSGHYYIKIITQDSNKTNKQTATRTVQFSVIPKNENGNSSTSKTSSNKNTNTSKKNTESTNKRKENNKSTSTTSSSNSKSENELRQKIANFAKSQVGKKLEHESCKIFGKSKSKGGWCSEFVSYCAYKCGYTEAGVYTKAETAPQGVSWFKKHSSFKKNKSYVPKPGDVMFTGSPSHTCIVYKVSGKYVYTVDGGGKKVGTHKRKIGSSNIYGYGIPLFYKIAK